MLVRTNHRILSSTQLASFTRFAAYECRVPKTRKPSREILKQYEQRRVTTSPCEHHFIPPQEILLGWKAELDQANRADARCAFYIECEFGLYNVAIINAALQLHKAKEIRRAVTQELDWLSETCRKPISVDSVPSRVLLNNFRSKIHNSPYSRVLGAIGMTPEELAQLCGERYLSGDHMGWIAKTLNQQQNEMFCAYANSTINVDRTVSRYLEAKKRNLPNKIGLIFNVYKARAVNRGQEQWNVQITPQHGSLGTHFSMATIDIEKKEIVYGDSLGWSPPAQLIDEVKKFYVSIFKEEMPEMEVIECHKSSSSGHGHCCSTGCSLHYPLQRDGNICGVVAATMLSVACLRPGFFSRIVGCKRRATDKDSDVFLANPSQFGKYLRQVMMAWISEGRISMKYLVPTLVLADDCIAGSLELSAETEETAEIELVEFPIDVPQDQQMQHHEYPLTTASCGVPDTKQTKEQGAVEKSKETKNPRAPKKERQNKNALQCKQCSYETQRGFNLRRHVLSNHGAEAVKSADNGGCICLTCGHKYFFIKDLRRHLTDIHGYVFRMTTKEFKTIEGKGPLQMI